MNKQLSMHSTGLQAVPLPVVMATCVASAALVTTFWLGWAIWLVAILVALAWFLARLPLSGLLFCPCCDAGRALYRTFSTNAPDTPPEHSCNGSSWADRHAGYRMGPFYLE